MVPSGLNNLAHQLQVASAMEVHPWRPAMWLGLRVAAALALPLILAIWLNPVVATWATMGGYGIALLDKGGAYRSRAAVQGLALIFELIVITGGTLISQWGPWRIPIMSMGIMACALLPGWGAAGASIGATVGVQLLVNASIPAHEGDLPLRLLGYLLGAGWAMVLTLGVWPVRVYKPGRKATGGVLAALAAHARLVRQPREDLDAWHRALLQHHQVVRDRLEAAREVLASTRRGTRGQTGRGERLLAVVQTAEQMMATLASLEEILETGCPRTAERILLRSLQNVEKACLELSERVLIEKRLPRARTPTWDLDLAREAISELEGRNRAIADHTVALLGRLQEDRMRASDHIDSLYAETQPVRVQVLDATPERGGVIWQLKTLLQPESVIFQHAVRVGVVTVVAGALVTLFRVPYGYWVTMTAFLLMQPYRVRTTTRAIQRTVGTVAGAMLAAIVATVLPDPLGMSVVLVILGGLSATVLQYNYALYALFVTPTFVLLLERYHPDSSLYGVRMMNTALGGLLAFLASVLLWPGREQIRFGENLAVALEKASDYLGSVVQAIREGLDPPVSSVETARRDLELAISNVNQVLDRVFAENLPQRLVEPRMTLVAFTQRLSSAINVFATTRGVISYGPHLDDIVAFCLSVQARLTQLAAAVRSGQRPELPPRSELEIQEPLIAARLERLEYQLSVLAEAASRAAEQEHEHRRDLAARRKEHSVPDAGATT